MRKIIALLMFIPCISWGQSTVTIRPNGNGSQSYSTASTGSQWECIDESSANDDADYIYDAISISDNFTHTSSGLTSETITNVKVVARARYAGGGGTVLTNYINPTVFVNSTMYYGDSYLLTSSYANYEADFPVNPDTGLAWTVSDIANMNISLDANYEEDSYTSEVRVTQLYAIITYTGGGGGSPTAFPTKLLLQGTGK